MEPAGGSFTICEATPEMVEGLACVNYTAWQETYRGIIHNTYLDGLTLETYLNRWRHIMQNRNHHSFILAALGPGGDVIGYCMGGRIMEPYANFEAEIYALYLLKKAHGQGIGGKLFKQAMLKLQQMNYTSVCLFVLKENPTIEFYRHYKPDFEKPEKVEIGGVEYVDMALGWSTIDSVLFLPPHQITINEKP